MSMQALTRTARLIAADMMTMVSFYEMVTGLSAQWLAPVCQTRIMISRPTRRLQRPRSSYGALSIHA